MTYETRNLDEASFLLYHKLKILKKDDEGGKAVIVFEDSEKLKQKLIDYVNGDSVEPKKFLQAYRSIRDFALKTSKKNTWKSKL